MSSNTQKNSATREIGLVAAREIKVRGLSKANVIALLVSVVAVGILAALPAIIGGDDEGYSVGIVGEGSPMATALENVEDVDISVHTYDSADSAEEALSDGDIDTAVNGNEILVDNGIDNALEIVVQSAHQSTKSVEQLEAQGYDAAEVQAAMQVEPLKEVEISASGGYGGMNYLLGLFISVFMLFMIMMPTQFIAMGVIEEKSSRIVEILLATMRPWQLLVGKILGLGVVSIITMIAILVTGISVASVTGTLPELPDGTTSALISTVGWWVLAFALFGALAGGMGAMVSRQEEAGSVLMPVTTLIMVAYLGTNISVLSDPESSTSEILSMIPPISAIAMPVRTAMTTVPTWNIIVAIVGLVIAALAAVIAGAAIYRRTVMHVGSRLKLKDVLKREPAR
ncbi:ABC transporter permease [Haloglycomyces albus]|uniref:ABC transporter permease n=1 Tax=Haloglycomyces albus TaxID=526067 RepID=UPI00046D3B4E|nr:ABC transporter permease [Haloglycomyces albus]